MFPPALRAGDTVAIVATARKITAAEIDPAVRLLESWGLRVELGATIGAADHQFAGADALRRADLQRALDDPTIRAVLCARGGYGTARLLDDVDWAGFQAHPKWVAGFSDLTALLAHVWRHTGLATLHATMPVLLGQPQHETADESLRQLLFGESVGYSAPPHPLNRLGMAHGRLLGGNLTVLHTLLQTASDADWTGAVLFLEDLDEYLYHIDRMLGHLARSGKLAGLAGLVVGHFSLMRDNTVPFGHSAYDIIRQHVAAYDFPVGFGFPAGHEPLNTAFIHGAAVALTVDSDAGLTLTYAAG
ncbi:MAG: LD-carboxypeptidase [Hymenobacteraceae bacterium]|nr:LD-carboxypeptidase [Hymenobacteraceae bacterium]